MYIRYVQLVSTEICKKVLGRKMNLIQILRIFYARRYSDGTQNKMRKSVRRYGKNPCKEWPVLDIVCIKFCELQHNEIQNEEVVKGNREAQQREIKYLKYRLYQVPIERFCARQYTLTLLQRSSEFSPVEALCQKLFCTWTSAPCRLWRSL